MRSLTGDPLDGKRITLAWCDGPSRCSAMGESLVVSDALEMLGNEAVLLAKLGVKRVTGLFFSDHQGNLKVMARESFVGRQAAKATYRETMDLAFRQSEDVSAIPGSEVTVVGRWLPSHINPQVLSHQIVDQAALEACTSQKSFIRVEGMHDLDIDDSSSVFARVMTAVGRGNSR